MIFLQHLKTDHLISSLFCGHAENKVQNQMKYKTFSDCQLWKNISSQKWYLKQFDFSSIRFSILYSIINPQMDSDTADHQNLNSCWSDDLP